MNTWKLALLLLRTTPFADHSSGFRSDVEDFIFLLYVLISLVCKRQMYCDSNRTNRSSGQIVASQIGKFPELQMSIVTISPNFKNSI